MSLKDRILQVNFEQALACIKEVLERHVAKHGEAPPFVVAVGGTAMAAHGIRPLSTDVDYYSPKIDEDIVYQVEKDMKENYGREFKIDATPGENIWGPIIFRDIADSSEKTVISIGDFKIPVKVMSVEDLVMVKLVADRSKDRLDLPLLAGRVEVDTLVDRFNVVSQWHGDRAAAMAFADAFIDFLVHHKAANARDIINRIAVPEYVKEMLTEARTLSGEEEDGIKFNK